MKGLVVFFSIFIVNFNVFAIDTNSDLRHQLRLESRNTFCKDKFSVFSGRNFNIPVKNPHALYMYCMAEFYRSEGRYNMAISYLEKP